MGYTSMASHRLAPCFSLLATLVALGFTAPLAAQRPGPMEPGVLRVCADPDNLRIQLQDVSFCGGVGPLGAVCQP